MWCLEEGVVIKEREREWQLRRGECGKTDVYYKFSF